MHFVLLFGSDFLAVDEPRRRRGALYVGSARAAVSVHHRVAAGAEGGEGSRTGEEVVHQAAAEVKPEAAERIKHAGCDRVLRVRVPVPPAVAVPAEIWVRKTTVT